MINRKSPRWSTGRQKGLALFISLVLLLVLTIIGISAVQTTSLETRMARNEHDVLLAFQAAESALRDAEERIDGLASTTQFTNSGNNGLFQMRTVGQPNRWEDSAIWENGAIEAPTDVGSIAAAPPRYFIEHGAAIEREENAYQIDDPYTITSTVRVDVFRISALGIGGTENARVLLQSTYGRVMN